MKLECANELEGIRDEKMKVRNQAQIIIRRSFFHYMFKKEFFEKLDNLHKVYWKLVRTGFLWKLHNRKIKSV